jgi:16S rRNA (guanine(966)-N(2))-methyltransferase RsmD
VKESIFNMIGPYQEMNLVLDLFAGSGALGIEALSRGASKVVFVESSYKAHKTIEKNLKELSIEHKASLFKQDAFSYLDVAKDVFDLIFLDPPYHSVDLDKVIERIQEEKLLSAHGLIVVLMDQTEEIKESEHFVLLKEKRITRTNVVFLKWGN